MSLASRIRENPKAFCMFIRSKRVLKNKERNSWVEKKKLGEVLNEYFAMLVINANVKDDGEIKEAYINILEHVDIKKMQVKSQIKKNYISWKQ